MAMTAKELKGEVLSFACEKAQSGTRKLLLFLEAKCVALEAKRHKSSAGDVLRSAGNVVTKAAGAVKDVLPTRKAGKKAGDAAEAVKEAAPVEEVGEAVSETVGSVTGALGGKQSGKEQVTGEEEERAEEGEGKHAKGDGEQKPEEDEGKQAKGNGGHKSDDSEGKHAKGNGEQRSDDSEGKHTKGNGEQKSDDSEGKPHGYVGLTTYPVELPEGLADETGTSSGLMLLAVEPDSPADEAGLLIGDTLLKLDGDPVEKRDDLVEQIGSHDVGDSLHAEVLRAGEAKDFTLEVGRPP